MELPIYPLDRFLKRIGRTKKDLSELSSIPTQTLSNYKNKNRDVSVLDYSLALVSAMRFLANETPNVPDITLDDLEEELLAYEADWRLFQATGKEIYVELMGVKE